MENDKKYGITLEKYTELIVKTINADVGDDDYKKLIEKEGILLTDWLKAKKAWEDKISDPNDEGKTAAIFMPIYEAALEKKYLGRVPCSLEDFTKIHCELSLKSDTAEPIQALKYESVLKENGLTANKWDICNSFWIVRVGLPNYRKKFSELVRKYSQENSNKKFGKVS
jgi:hypothetical protein